jgi:hypothetical protein
MRNVGRNLGGAALGLILLCGAAILVWKFILPAMEPGGRPAPPPATDHVSRLPARFVEEFARADDFDAGEMLRAGREQYPLPSQRAELAELRAKRAPIVRARAEERIDQLIAELRFLDAVREARRYRSVWPDETADLEEVIGAAELEQIDQRTREAEQLVEEGRYVAARESLDVTPGLFHEESEALLAKARTIIERRIRVRSYEASRHGPVIDGGPTQPAKVGHPSPPPSLPGSPHADVRRLGDARRLLAKASALFRAGKYAPLAKAAEDLVGYFGDLKLVERRIDGLRAVRAYARYKTTGFAALFHATKVKRSGKSLSLTYTFASPDEHFDWEAMKLIPHADSGQFDPARNGVRGTGVAGYVHRAFFQDDVEIRCKATLQQPKSHGLAFVEAGREQRQVILLATNHWFTEGENYVKKRPGHSILLIGKGVNNDVPVDSPEIGFVFKGPSVAKPAPGPGAEISESLAVLGANVRATVSYRGDDGSLRVSARGDDGRGFRRHRPALFVVQAGVIFRDIHIRGKIDPKFEEERERELLDAIEAALAEAP